MADVPQEAENPQADQMEKPAGGPQIPQGGVQELVARISKDMNQLLGIVESSKSLAPEDVQPLHAAEQAYSAFVQKLGEPQGQQAPKPPGAPGGALPPEAGNAQVRQAL